jgi:phospholipid/cholesterol/gamma-HCH transport system ATP-binding protein
VLGRSGTGKSVTLRLMIGLIKPDAGDIFISGNHISCLEGKELSRARCKIGFLFQSAALFDSYTLYDNLALPLRRLTAKSNSEIEEIVDRGLKQVGLAGDKHKLPGALSGGMRKRAGLARALVLEPSSGLDRITASEIDDLLLEQKALHQTTMVIVTHDVHGARRVGDRFAVLDQGRLIALGKPEELEDHESETVRKLVTEN